MNKLLALLIACALFLNVALRVALAQEAKPAEQAQPAHKPILRLWPYGGSETVPGTVVTRTQWESCAYADYWWAYQSKRPGGVAEKAVPKQVEVDDRCKCCNCK